jgi:hypothetical protein
MDSLYPMIYIDSDEEEAHPSSKVYYFVTKSGKVCEIQANSKGHARTLYAYMIFPNTEPPLIENACLCFTIINLPDTYCNGRYCNCLSDHFTPITERDFRRKVNVIFLRNLLCRYPDFAEGRFKAMYWENPIVEEGDYESYAKEPDGSIQYYNPKSFTYIWKKANIRMKTSYNSYVSDKDLFSIAMASLTGEKVSILVCYAWIEANIRNLTPRQKDMVMGSFRPLTKLPITTEEVAEENEIHKNKNYPPIHITPLS